MSILVGHVALPGTLADIVSKLFPGKIAIWEVVFEDHTHGCLKTMRVIR